MTTVKSRGTVCGRTELTTVTTVPVVPPPHVPVVSPHVPVVSPHVAVVSPHIAVVPPHVSIVPPHVSIVPPHVAVVPPLPLRPAPLVVLSLLSVAPRPLARPPSTSAARTVALTAVITTIISANNHKNPRLVSYYTVAVSRMKKCEAETKHTLPDPRDPGINITVG